MSNKPFKTSGWPQAIFEQSATKKIAFGTLRITQDGRKFRYAKAGEALTAGNVGHMADAIANHIKQTGLVAAVGATQITMTVGATALTANQYDDGYLHIYDGTAGTVGQQYLISSHTTSTAGSTAVTFQLAEPIRIAVITTDTWSLIPNPWSAVLENAAVAHGGAGIAPIAVTSGYCYWAQTGGQGVALNVDATALGSPIVNGATTGTYKTMAAYDSPVLGFANAYASITAKYNPVFLTID